jgi:hypothetical protein
MVLLALAVIWVAALAHNAPRIDSDWIPHDEGTIGHSADRVLAGELPHRDYDEIYTGGLSYINAASFRLLGRDLHSPRLVIVALFLLAIPVMYYAASRFVSPLAALASTALIIVWSLPNYIVALPTWYNVILAMLGMAAVLRYIETDDRRWLVVGGVCAGLSFLVKIIALYFIAGVLLMLVYREQERAREHPAGPGAAVGYVVFTMLGLAAFVFALGMFAYVQPGASTPIHFFLPGAVVAGLVARNAWQTRDHGSSAERIRALVGLLGPFVLGAAIPVALFLVPYALSGSLGAFMQGVFITPTRRLANASAPPPSILQSKPAILLFALLATALMRLPKRVELMIAGAVAVAGALIVFVSHDIAALYRGVWGSIRIVAPVIVVVGAAALVMRQASGRRRQAVMLALAVCAMAGLIQAPFAVPIYFCYTTPFVIIAIAAVASLLPVRAPAIVGAVMAFYAAFAYLRVNTGYVYFMGVLYVPNDPLAVMEMPGAERLRASAPIRDVYRSTVDLLRKHATSEYVYVSPDAPEMYYLAGLKNPTRTIFDFFDDPTDRTKRILDTLERRNVSVIAINLRPNFSGLMPPDLKAELAKRYPTGQRNGWFEVRWR